MKKLLIFSLSWVYFLPLDAQLLIGPKAGPQVNWVKIDDEDSRNRFDNDLRIGYNLGAMLTFFFADRFSLESQIFYSRKGKKQTILESDLRHKAVYSYIDFPISLRYNINEFSKNYDQYQYYVKAGPNFSYWLNGHGTIGIVDYTVEFGDFEPKLGVVSIEDPNRFQVGFDVGVGTIWQIRPKQYINVEIDFNVGHTFISETQPEVDILGFEDDLRAFNRSISITLAYLFELNFERDKAEITGVPQDRSRNQKRRKRPPQLRRKKTIKKNIKDLKRRKIFNYKGPE